MERIKIIFVAGSGHSGSTLLALLLDSHPEIASVGEVAIKPMIRRQNAESSSLCSCGAPVHGCGFWKRVFALVQQEGFDFGPGRWTNDYRFEHPLARRLFNRACFSPFGREMVNWAAAHLPVYRERVALIDRVNVSFFRAVLNVSGAKVFADTTKGLPRLLHLLRIPQLDPRLVLLSRDVRGYAASAKRRGHLVSDAARTWRRTQVGLSRVAERFPPEHVYRLRYEDLCGQPKDTLRKLWTFAGVGDVEPPDFVESAQHHVLGNSMRMSGQIRIRLDESWRERLDSEEASAILEIAGDVNRTLGYA